MISLIVAVSTNNAIGIDNALPWEIPADMRRFKKLTMGKPIVMGRKTHFSIGKVLPGRDNIVLSRNSYLVIPGCQVIKSLDALDANKDNMIIGGEQVYKLALPLADKIYLTRVHGDYEGDTFFPYVDWDKWAVVEQENHGLFSFYTYVRNYNCGRKR